MNPEPESEARATMEDLTVDTFHGLVADGEDAPVYLAPRLAAYAPLSTSSSEDTLDERAHTVVDSKDEEERRHGEAKEAESSLSRKESNDPRRFTALVDEDVEADDVDDTERWEEDDTTEETVNVFVDAREDETEDVVDICEADEKACANSDLENLTTFFPASRVKDLLKFEGSSVVISRDASLAASEAVVLVLRDMARTAAAEAQRRQRKTVTYDDIAHTVQMLDRFAYLSDVIPPAAAVAAGAAAPSTGGAAGGQPASVVIGAPRQLPVQARGVRARRAGAVAKAGASSAAGVSGSSRHTSASGQPVAPGAGTWRQTTLGF